MSEQFEYYTPKQYIEKNKQEGRWPNTEGSLRHLIFNEDKNGFKGAFFKIGRSVFINHKVFLEKIEQFSQNETKE